MSSHSDENICTKVEDEYSLNEDSLNISTFLDDLSLATCDKGNPLPNDTSITTEKSDLSSNEMDSMINSSEEVSMEVCGTDIKAVEMPKATAVACSIRGNSIEIIGTTGKLTKRFFKTYEQICQLEEAVRNRKLSNTDFDDDLDGVILPEFPKDQSGNTVYTFCSKLNSFFSSSRVSGSKDLDDFITDTAGNKPTTIITAIDFVLQPFEYETKYIPRGALHSVDLHVNEDSVAVWKFEVENFDIEFRVLLIPQNETDEVATIIIHPTTRYSADFSLNTVKGSYNCECDGIIRVIWDNSYSRFRGKTIRLITEIVHKDTMNSASLAADALCDAQGRNITGNCVAFEPLNEVDNAYVKSLAEYGTLVKDTGSWFLHGTVAAARMIAYGSGELESKSEGVPASMEVEASQYLPSSNDTSTKEINNIQDKLLHRVESLEDSLAREKALKDGVLAGQKRLQKELESANAKCFELEAECLVLSTKLDRFSKERDAWIEIQEERDQLLVEKHRWALMDEFELSDNNTSSSLPQNFGVDTQQREKLENELVEAESTVIRLRAQLGYAVSNHLTGTSSRLEKLAKEMVQAKSEYEKKLEVTESEMKELKDSVLKYKSQKQFLLNEIRNTKRAAECQVAVAMTDASECRMVNRRLKCQKELLLGQVRKLLDSKQEEHEHTTKHGEERGGGQQLISQSKAYTQSSELHDSNKDQSYKQRLIKILSEHDQSLLSQVDSMLESYRGAEDALIDSLELKYSFSDIESTN